MKHETSYHLGIRFLVLVVAMVVVISAAREAFGQVETTTADGLATETLKTGQGTSQINLPDEMLGPVSGSVRAFPAGQTAEEKARNLDVLNTYAIRIQDKDTRVAAGVFRRVFSGSERAVNLILVDRAGKELARDVVPVQPLTAVSCLDVMTPKITVPKLAQAGRPLQIQGPALFDGDSISTTVKIDSRNAEVLAENSRETIVECPTGTTGPVNLQIKKNQTEFQQELRVVDVSLTAPKLDLRSGEQTTLTTQVKGLTGLQEELSLHLQNQSPSVIQLTGGDSQNISIQPNEVQGDVYTCTRTVTGKRPGGFNLTATAQDLAPVTVPLVVADQILTTDQTSNRNQGPNAGTRDEYSLPGGVVELNRSIAQQAWSSPNVSQPGRNPCCCCCCPWWQPWRIQGGPGPGPGP